MEETCENVATRSTSTWLIVKWEEKHDIFFNLFLIIFIIYFPFLIRINLKHEKGWN